MKIMYINTVFVVLLFTATACVPQKQYQYLQEKNDECKKTKEELFRENEKLRVENTELKSKLEVSEDELNRIKGSEEGNIKDYHTLKTEYNALKKRYDELVKNYDAALNGSDSETRNLLSKLENSQKSLNQREEELNDLSEDLEKEKAEIALLRKELDERNKKLVELEKLIAAKDAQVDEIRQKVSKALIGFEGQGLTVTKKNGKVYVSLEEKLLFPSGSTELNERGKSAIIKLGKVLEVNEDIQITIEGHTDDVPVIPGSKFIDNWDLSVQRANVIIRILLANSDIDPKRLTAAGRGPYVPVDPRKTEDARQKNRRTEIILTPDLDEIFSIIDSN